MNKLLCLISALTVTTLSLPAQAKLINNGGGLIYDSVLNVTWLQDANLAATNKFGVSNIQSDGSMNWNTAEAWIAAMNAADYLGQSNWALPTTPQTDSSCNSGGVNYGYNCTGSQMGELFYTEGGLTANKSINSSSILTSDFKNMQSTALVPYWSGTVPTNYSNDAFFFYTDGTSGGYQSYSQKAAYNFYAWAVLPGDVGAAPTKTVPEPATLMLLGMGMVGLGWARRRG